MVDRYLNCPVKGCDGVAVTNETDLRKKNILYRCNKCGCTFTVSRKSLDFGKNTFANFNDLRGQIK